MASWIGNVAIVKMLLQAGANVNRLGAVSLMCVCVRECVGECMYERVYEYASERACVCGYVRSDQSVLVAK